MFVQSSKVTQTGLEDAELVRVSRALGAGLLTLSCKPADFLIFHLEYDVRAEQGGQLLEEALLYRENSDSVDERLE